MTPRGAIPAERMDPTTTRTHSAPLAAFVDELRGPSASGPSRTRCRPAPASRSRCCRCSSRRCTSSSGGRCSSCCPRTPTRETRPRRPAGCSARSASRCFPGRGVSPRVGARAAAAPRGRALPRARRARRGGLVCASAVGARRGHAAGRGAARPPSSCGAGDEPGVDGLAEALALAGYERVDRVEDRGQFAVRGGIVDVFPSTGREPLRVELFGDEIEQVRAFSPFTQRALHTVEHAVVYPAAERRADLVEPTSDRRGRAAPRLPDDLVPPRRSAARHRLAARRRARGLGGGGARARSRSTVPPSSTRSRAASRSRSRRSDRRSPPAASPRPRTSSPALVRGGQPRRRRVRPPRRGAAPAGAAAQGRRAARSSRRRLSPHEPGVRFAVAPVRRGFVWRELGLVLLPATQVFRKRPPRADARLGRALASFADLRVGDHVVHEDHGVGKLLGFETKEVAGVTRDYLLPRVPRRRPALRPARADRQALAVRRRGRDARRSSRSSAARPGTTSRRAPASRCASSPASCSSSTRSASAPRAIAYDIDGDWLERLEASFPYRETDDQAARDRGGQGGPRGAAADGPARLRRRRLRQDRGRRPGRVRRRRRAAGRCSSSARRRSSPSSTGTPSASATATSRSASRWSRASAGRPRSRQCSRSSPKGRSRCSSARTASSRAT